MADGYIDPTTGQFIPGSFADQLDMPSAGSTDTQGAQQYQSTANKQKSIADKAMKDYNTQKQISSRAMTAYNRQKAIAAKYMAIYSKKGATKAQKAAATKARNAALAEMKKQTTIRNAAIKQQGKLTTTRNTAITAQNTAQNKAYELSGQYEKLLEGDQRDAYAALKSLFAGYGLGTLAPKIYDYAKQGYGADVISLLLQDTPEYKERFSANADRAKNGLPVLSPAEYLSTEQAYRQILQDAGLPKGFYDNPADFRTWLGGDVSPTEVKGRVDLAVANTMQANNNTKRALQQLYGVDNAYVTAYFLDPKAALPLLQKQSQAAQFGAEALKRNLTLDKQDLEDFVTAGLSLSQVSQGFQAVSEALPNIQAIAARYGEDFTQRELEKDLIEGDVTGNVQDARFLTEAPTNKRKRLASQERALFGGYGGATPGGLSAGSQTV